MHVTVRGPFDDVVLVDSFRATAADRAAAMTPTRATFWLRSLADRSLDLPGIASFDTLGSRGELAFSGRPATPALLRRSVEEALTAGWLLAIPRERRRVAIALLPDEEPALGPDASENARVDFCFDFVDGTAVRDLGYVFEEPAGTRSPGKLPGDGTVFRTNAAGTYSVSLKEIDVLAWAASRARATDAIGISGRATGLDDGASGTLRVYRLYEEAEKDALATLPVTVAAGAFETTWNCDPTKPLGTPDGDGLVYCVTELSFEDGTVWRKTAPLALELPAIVGIDASPSVVGPTDELSLAIRTTGFTDAADLTVTLFRHEPAGDDTRLGDAPKATLSGGTATVALGPGSAALPARTGDVFAAVTVKEAGVEREAVSAVFRVEMAPGDAATDDDAADVAA